MQRYKHKTFHGGRNVLAISSTLEGQMSLENTFFAIKLASWSQGLESV